MQHFRHVTLSPSLSVSLPLFWFNSASDKSHYLLSKFHRQAKAVAQAETVPDEANQPSHC